MVDCHRARPEPARDGDADADGDGDGDADLTCELVDCEPGTCCVEGCGGVDDGASCVPTDVACERIYAPVCGCDGNTYGNDCEAHDACVAISYEGECDVVQLGCEVILCIEGTSCVEGCGGLDRTTCVPFGDACEDIYAPVCGCDGNTYGNDCEAHNAGMAIDYEGECVQIAEPL